MEIEPSKAEYFEFAVRDGLRQRNRGALDIVDSILKACMDGALKTHILYRCNLSSRQIGQYLDFLAQRGLLEHKIDEIRSREFYLTTHRGRNYVSLYEQLCKTLITSMENQRSSPSGRMQRTSTNERIP
jgi:predicted transcriptional regulator